MKEILYDWNGANVWLFHFINDIRGDTLDRVMTFGSQLGAPLSFSNYLGLIALFAVAHVAHVTRRHATLVHEQTLRWLALIAVFAIAYVIDTVIVSMLKYWLDFPRPPLALGAAAVHSIGAPEFHHSLPSGHASFAALLAASLWPALNRYGRIAAILYVLWVGVSRVSLGVHFPADVLLYSFTLSLAVVLPIRSFVYSTLGVVPSRPAV
ncbi:MAG: phosphatase PAP2 family protein [Gammaproteobacteria bacterium]|nr:phosphatase PAP2 family protein [Gammaproteobacteria bacterium]